MYWCRKDSQDTYCVLAAGATASVVVVVAVVILLFLLLIFLLILFLLCLHLFFLLLLLFFLLLTLSLPISVQSPRNGHKHVPFSLLDSIHRSTTVNFMKITVLIIRYISGGVGERDLLI